MINPLIAPTTNVRLLGDIPLDNTYTDTIKFTDANSQSAYFLGKTKLSFNNLTYQRLTPNNPQWALFLECSADQVYDCNYIMYQNEGFSSKWFYAFIVEILYVSENCTAITFEIDVMQTWLFDFEIKRSFIERMHVTDDRLGRNVMAENLDYGPRYYTRSQITPGMTLGTDEDNAYANNSSTAHYCILVATAEDCEESDMIVEGGMYSGIYQGLRYLAFAGEDDCNKWLKAMNEAGKAGAIVSISMVPTLLVLEGGEISGKTVVDPRNCPLNGFTFSVEINKSDIDGYEPKNNKLFMYPYNFLEVNTMDGNAYTFKWEDFDGYEEESHTDFVFKGNISSNPTIYCMPQGYLHIQRNNEYGMKLSNFPQCSWVNDTYANWFAQNDVSIALGTISNVIGASTSGLGGGGGAKANAAGAAIGAAVGVVQSGLDTFSTMSSAYSKPDTVHGATNTGGINVSFGVHTFWFISKNIHWGYAQKIDDYLWKFGYRVCATGVPPLSRPYWDYLKMQRPSVVGNIPVNDMAKIKEILSNGITFWHTTDVGNYSLNNNEGVLGH